LKTILLFGAGKSATVLINYLIKEAASANWHLVIADADHNLITAKTNNAPCTTAIAIDINDGTQRCNLIAGADIVISLMPATLHILIAKDCLQLGKHLLTASYVDEELRQMSAEVSNKNILFLCEMGLDPGIDHMSAMKLIDNIKQNNGYITSFKSHCGGLVAPECDDNPWRYKISWNPRNIVMAGKAGAVYKFNGTLIKERYDELFEVERGVRFNDTIAFLSYYPNRDSLSYIDTYGLQEADTFLRTTLRYPDFMYGWNNVIELKLTDETIMYDTDGLSVAAFFKQHFNKVDFGTWLNKKLSERIAYAKEMGEKLQKMLDAAEMQRNAAAEDPDIKPIKDFSIVNENGEIETIDIEATRERASYAIAHKMHEANLTLKQLFFLGMDDNDTIINKGKCTVVDIMQFILEKKLALQLQDKDMIVMLHEIEYKDATGTHQIKSSLLVKGEDSLRTAMAKTVGLPLGIAAKLILNGTITATGLQIPTDKAIYQPVLAALEAEGIVFTETYN
jgi:saccharopine dehydrogenase-like NADP-dependent oxidoreductase